MNKVYVQIFIKFFMTNLMIVSLDPVKSIKSHSIHYTNIDIFDPKHHKHTRLKIT